MIMVAKLSHAHFGETTSYDDVEGQRPLQLRSLDHAAVIYGESV